MAIGLSRKEFYHSTLLALREYDDAYVLRRKMQDEISYYEGYYTYIALETALANAFRKKGAKPAEYPKEPLLHNYEQKKELTREEKKEQVGILFANLADMQRRFERSKAAG